MIDLLNLSSVVHGYIKSSVCSYFFTFFLMTTGAFSQNASKLFSELKLVTDNLFIISAVHALFIAHYVGVYSVLKQGQ